MDDIEVNKQIVRRLIDEVMNAGDLDRRQLGSGRWDVSIPRLSEDFGDLLRLELVE